MLGTAKLFGKDASFALYDISYKNALLYARAMPMPGDGDDDKDSNRPLFDESKDACDINNFNDFIGDEQIVRV